jgi:hypothetical protein
VSTREIGELEKKYAKQIGDDIVATCEVNYWNFKPIEDNKGAVVGTKVTHIVCIKPNGSIPDMFVNQMLGREA